MEEKERSAMPYEESINNKHSGSTTCNRPKSLPMKLKEYTPDESNNDGIFNLEDQFKDAAIHDARDEGIENGVYDSEDYYAEESEEEVIMETVYAFADYTVTDNESSENQLSFVRGDRLEVIAKDDPDWWWGKKNDTYGYIASNHVKSNPPDTEDCGGNSWQDEEYFGSYSQMRLHMEMLEDNPRTDAYRKAIVQNKKHIKDKVVLDVGCGSGILSFFCAKYGQAKRVYAVEASNFAHYTKKLVDHNGLSDQIVVIKGKIEDQQLPEPVDLIISEWMGTFLLFEWMIECVLYARDCWLSSDGVMWPSHAHIYIVPSSANRQLDKLTFWNSVHGFDFTPLIPVAQQEFFSKPVYNHDVESGSCLSRPSSILDIDMKTISIFDLVEVTNPFSFIIQKSGTFHGFASWFSVDFGGYPTTNGQAPVVLDTGPDFPTTHWKQDFFMMDEAVQLYKGDQINGTVSITRNYEWKRHLSVELDFTVTSKTIGIKKYKKVFPIWR